ncbi:winged helix-turn-helix transcriptional regulator [Cellulomonas sp. zg-ZUI222]|uniref:Winged helix-turn-helix transcriptional regulator n=1 Tax=Cellulomonas wangleii TaxID=2816956 RepID=A0ABX8D5B1_9CELL|nr:MULTISPECIES: metalloregulator ArsR/SmtB family transcription factor [Cellulomonas]MBO0898768.1 winged helix-turn-helix transcriptional regulator [Cellulomonas sp. zg-ZUI22]MBO0919629.1 winged helix-turn-helix transcriptional regulator [Cellulomonas wangleii]MBO0923944.1 winged helix-turn-helix transcriptional regulator [Cellulomonas wangleii]MBO0924226.1 winged helix-turn-helix transcriptional regulator [Cellulomonas wangleii]QVI62238.1 winged helix-turn-helix transcriptional regulator [Ce
MSEVAASATAADGTPARAERAGAVPVDVVLAALAEPVRRRLLEHLGRGERAAGELVAAAADEFGISQPATSQHLRVLREAGVVTVRADGPRRLYRVEPGALSVVEDWLAGFLDPFAQPLDALGTELARGRRQRRDAGGRAPGDARATPAS